MPKKNKKRVEIKYPEIAVFALSKGSQMNEHIINSETHGMTPSAAG